MEKEENKDIYVFVVEISSFVLIDEDWFRIERRLFVD